MRRVANIAVTGVVLLSLVGCGGGSDGSANNGGGDGGSYPQSFSSIDVSYLQDGFIIDGYNEAGEEVTLEYCGNRYRYYSGEGYWYGHFSIKEDRINMFDETPTGGSYRIDTYNYHVEVGIEYSIDFQNDEIIVEQITEDLACR